MQVKVVVALAGWLLVIIALDGSSWLEMPACRGQEAVVGSDASGPTFDSLYPGGYKSVKACRLCHRGQIRELDPDQDRSFVLLNEPAIWLTDPHSKAFALIDWSAAVQPPRSNPQTDPAPNQQADQQASRQLSREICEKLGIADIHQARQCLSCHANWVAGLDQPPPLYAAGVGCESCHGPSAAWENEHKEPSWRARPVAYKTAKGMIDVRNPIKRAEQCFSCHIGDVQQGKVLTHAMYAAGHPPLPSIEIESFAKQMPRHWRYLEEKIADSRNVAGDAPADTPPFAFFDEFVRENHRYLTPQNPAGKHALAEHHHAAAAVVLGAAVALREAVELTRDLVRQEADDLVSWPELSAFDCTACHHDLKRPGRSQTRGPASRPGRPAMPVWPNTLVRLAIFHVSPNSRAYQDKLAAFHAKLTAVQDNLAATPFGDPSLLERDATNLIQWLTDELITPVAEKPFDEQAVRLACIRLVHIGGGNDHDFASARQIAWALRALYCDLDVKPAGDPQIQAVFRQLAADLRLDLPNSSGENCETTAREAAAAGDAPRDVPRNQPVPLAGSVSAALAAAMQYDPQQFVRTMNELQLLLKWPP